jgi:7-cyano-7-deazaguanine synthase
LSKIEPRKAVIILSGGLDSSGVTAFWAKEGYFIYLLTFNYGQRATQEIRRAQEIGRRVNAREHKIIDISFMKELYGSTNVLTDPSKEMPSSFQSNIIVPIRNGVFLTIAAAYSFSIGANIVAYGAHLSDQPYPDCRPEFTKALADALNLGDIDAVRQGLHPRIDIWSPAVQGLSKEAMLRISYDILKDAVYRTWSCYEDGDFHCGRCESCNNRRKAFKLAGIDDLTTYAS